MDNEIETSIPTTNTSNVANPQGFLQGSAKTFINRTLIGNYQYIDLDEWAKRKNSTNTLKTK